MSAETWRVIDEDGAEHATIVETSEGKLVAVTIRRRCGYPCDTRVRAAIAREAWADDIAVAEILAPGQPSRAEVEAEAFRRGVEAMREAAALHFARRSEGIEHAAAKLSCIAPTAAACATLDEARRIADVADEIRALKVAP